MDEVVPFPPGPPPPLDDDIAEGHTLPERADEVERRLGMALKAYRQKAEDILEKHFDDMEKCQLRHDHEISILKAENAKLREMHGMPDDPSLLQSVMFQTMTPVVAPKSK